MRIVLSGLMIAILGITADLAIATSIIADAPTEIPSIAVKKIDEHYLYTSSRAWQSARARIVESKATDRDTIWSEIARALASMRDPELHLVNPAELVAIQNEGEGKTLGAGLMEFSVDVVPSTGEARIVTPLAGSPAAIAGLRPRDIVVAVNGRPTRELDHEQLLDVLRSSAKTEIVIRRGEREFSVQLVPSNEPLHSTTARSLPGAAANFAYIRISQFTRETAGEVRDAVRNFETRDTRGYILDLRNNPGGFLDSATQVAGFFVSGRLGTKVRRDRSVEPITSAAPALTQAPVAVLVNEGTASAAELVAGALQARKRALLIGARTYGRGQAQVYESLSDGYGLIIPSALLRTPDGRLFKGRGLRPDIHVASQSGGDARSSTANDRQLQRALSTLQSLTATRQ